MLERNFIHTALLFVAFVQTGAAQGAGEDQFTVKFDRSVQIGSQTLPSGTYTVRQATNAAKSRVLEFSSGSTKLDTTFTEIPSLQSTAPTETKAILEDEGNGARLSRIWVQGKNYGYEFPGKTVPVTEPAVVSSQTRADAPQNYVRPATASELAEVETAETPAPTPVDLQAQVQPQPQPAPITPAPENPASAVAQTTPTPVTNTQPIPATALGWVSILFAGVTVAAAGLFLFLRSERSVR